VLDTNVFSPLKVTPPRASAELKALMAAWQRALQGKRVVIAFQTVAEARAGALTARWKAKRRAELEAILRATPVIHTDSEVVEAFALLTAECKAQGHALQAKEHTGDRWIAACAIAKSLPLLSRDKIFRDAPLLDRLDVASD
jgi:predicted nucleic acid-binding protein